MTVLFGTGAPGGREGVRRRLAGTLTERRACPFRTSLGRLVLLPRAEAKVGHAPPVKSRRPSRFRQPRALTRALGLRPETRALERRG